MFSATSCRWNVIVVFHLIVAAVIDEFPFFRRLPSGSPRSIYRYFATCNVHLQMTPDRCFAICDYGRRYITIIRFEWFVAKSVSPTRGFTIRVRYFRKQTARRGHGPTARSHAALRRENASGLQTTRAGAKTATFRTQKKKRRSVTL